MCTCTRALTHAGLHGLTLSPCTHTHSHTCALAKLIKRVLLQHLLCKYQLPPFPKQTASLPPPAATMLPFTASCRSYRDCGAVYFGVAGGLESTPSNTQQLATQAKLTSTSQSCVGPYCGVALIFKTLCAPKMLYFGCFFVLLLQVVVHFFPPQIACLCAK